MRIIKIAFRRCSGGGEKRYASYEKKNTRKNEKNAIRQLAIRILQVVTSHSFRCFYSLFFMYTYFTVIYKPYGNLQPGFNLLSA